MSDLSNIGNNCKAKLHEKETRTDTVPIKIVDTNYSNSKSKSCHRHMLGYFYTSHLKQPQQKEKTYSTRVAR